MPKIWTKIRLKLHVWFSVFQFQFQFSVILKGHVLSRLVFTSNAKVQERLFHRENAVDSSTRIKILPFPCACSYACIRLRCVKMKRCTSRRKFATCDQLKHSFQIPCILAFEQNGGCRG